MVFCQYQLYLSSFVTRLLIFCYFFPKPSLLETSAVCVYRNWATSTSTFLYMYHANKFEQVLISMTRLNMDYTAKHVRSKICSKPQDSHCVALLVVWTLEDKGTYCLCMIFFNLQAIKNKLSLFHNFYV